MDENDAILRRREYQRRRYRNRTPEQIAAVKARKQAYLQKPEVRERNRLTKAKYRLSHREQENKKAKKWRDTHPEYQETNRLYQREWRRKYPNYQQKLKWKHWLERYGISPDEYDKLVAEHQGLCAICQQPQGRIMTHSKQQGLLFVDHNHKTNAIRGLLCAGCNTGLGCFGDDISRLEKAIAYLKRHNVREIHSSLTVVS